MTADELKTWLKEEQSEHSGWSKDDGSGETVGHEREVLCKSHWNMGNRSTRLYVSGRKIIEILETNPKKDTSKYKEEDLGHMRKVVSYNKRHLAQHTNSKSYKSLKYWGIMR